MENDELIEIGVKALIAGLVAAFAVLASGNTGGAVWAGVAIAFGRAAVQYLAIEFDVKTDSYKTSSSSRSGAFGSRYARLARKYL